jgi:Ca2+-binding EF-hand superfamily protein
MLQLASFYNTPFLQSVLFFPGDEGVGTIDVSVSVEPTELATLPGIASAYVIAIEEFPLDAMRSPSGDALKDVSHPQSRWLYLSEIERVLSVKPEVLGYEEGSIDEGPGMTMRLHFARVDRDRNGWIEGEESGGGLASADKDGDDRVTLGELAEFVGIFETGRSEAAEEVSVFLQTRVDEDGDLTRLLDGIDPFVHDKDSNYGLDREEAESAFFEAVDLDGDERVTLSELSRYPGSRRRLRYGGVQAETLFKKEEQTGDGSLSRREFKLLDEEWFALDGDRDGLVLLERPVTREERRTGGLPLPPEWPMRRGVAYSLPPDVSVDQLMERWDLDGDGLVSKRESKLSDEEWRRFRPNAGEGGSVRREELEGVVRRITRRGVEVCGDSFEARWDWDRDGRVEEDELELPLWLELRLLGPQK